MKMFVAGWWSVVVLAGLTMTGSVAAEEGLRAVPGDSSVVARVASVQEVLGRIDDLARASGLPLDDYDPDEIRENLLEGLQLSKAEGAINESKPAYVVAPGRLRPRSRRAYLVQTEDEDRLRRAVLDLKEDEEISVGEEKVDGFTPVAGNDQVAYFARRGDWVIYTKDKSLLRRLDDAWQDEEKSLAATIDPQAKEALLAGSGAVWVNVEFFTTRFKDRIDEARQQTLEGIDSLPADALGGGANGEAVKTFYKALAKLAFQAVFDARWAVGNVALKANAAGGSYQVGFAEGSKTSEAVTAYAPSPLEVLELLPEGAPMYFAFKSNDELMKAYLELVQNAYSQDEEARKAFGEMIEATAKAGVEAVAGSFAPPPDATTGFRYEVLYQAEKTEPLRMATRKMVSAYPEVKTPLFTQKYSFKADAEEYKERPVDLMTLAMEFPEDAEQQQKIAQQFIEQMFGGEKLEIRMTALEGIMALASGNDPKHLHALVDGLESGEGVAGLNNAFTKARDELDEEANVIMMADFPRLMLGFVNTFRKIPGIGQAIAQAPFNFGAQPPESYAAFSLSTRENGLRVKWHVPIEQVRGFATIFVGQGL